jgi:cell division protein FtsB
MPVYQPFIICRPQWSDGVARKASNPRIPKRSVVSHQPGVMRQILTNTRLVALLLLSALILVILMGLTVWGEHGLLAMWRKQGDVARLVQEIEAIERENARLSHEIQHLRNDMQHIEAIAREELGLVKEDELVFEFVDKLPR